ncbi:MAG: serine/threonine protein kinase, partial [Myxococcales bacterium]|nr:serine/threonine protein kinase [Myxococcales bacterium]
MQSASEITATHTLPARLPRGFELGDYVVDGWVRDGGMAAIYRAVRAVDGTRVALKLQLPSTAHRPEICARFDREAEAMRRIAGGPNVIELLDADVLEDGRRYFVMEWVAGEDLDELLDFRRNQDQRLSIEQACRIGRAIASGLATVHEHQLVHRDLKPANVMIGEMKDGAEVVKLVDFGIVADLRPGAEGAEAPVDEEIMGTSAYMAPEQVAGEPPEPRIDLFALGVVLYEVLTGSCVPPDGWSPETLPGIETLRRGVPAELVELVRSCMSRDPAQRPDSAAVVAGALAEISLRVMAGEGGTPSSEEIPIRTGATEITPRAEVEGAEEPVVRTGETEVALTHQQVLSISGRVRAPRQAERPGSASVDLAGVLESEAPSQPEDEAEWIVTRERPAVVEPVGAATREPAVAEVPAEAAGQEPEVETATGEPGLAA